jgi:hypothetical protein
LFDPSNTEVNTVEGNKDKEVNYRGEVLLAPFSFMSAESVAQHRALIYMMTVFLTIKHEPLNLREG